MMRTLGGGGGNSPDVLVVTTFHFLLAKDFYHKSDVFLSIVIGKTLYSYTKWKKKSFVTFLVGVESRELKKIRFPQNFLWMVKVQEEGKRIFSKND